MSKITTRAISFESKMDLALKIVQSAPVGYTGFELHKPTVPDFTFVTYAKGIGGQYFSIGKLASELGIGEAEKEPVPESAIYVPSKKTALAVRQGRVGFVLFK